MNGVEKGSYRLNVKSNNVNEEVSNKKFHHLGMNEPIGEFIMNRSTINKTENKLLKFDITNNKDKISVVESLKRQHGYLTLKKLIVDSFEREEHLIFNAIDQEGNIIPQETCEKLFYCKAIQDEVDIENSIEEKLDNDAKLHIHSKMNKISEANQQYFKEEQKRLMKWEDDMLYSIEEDLKKVKAQIRRKEREKLSAMSEREMLEIDEEITALTRKRRKLRNEIEDMEDEVKEKRRKMTEHLRKEWIQYLK